MLLQNLYISFSINRAFTDVQATQLFLKYVAGNKLKMSINNKKI